MASSVGTDMESGKSLSGRALQVRIVLRKHSRAPFQYGAEDCCQFLNDISIAISGVDHSIKFPLYDGESYEDVLQANGGVEGIATICLGDPCATEELHVGDCALVALNDISLLGVWDGSTGAFAKTDKGMIRIDKVHIAKGWHI